MKKIADIEAKDEALKVDHSKSQAEYKKFYEDNMTSTSGKVAGLRYAALIIEERRITLQPRLWPSLYLILLLLTLYYLCKVVLC